MAKIKQNELEKIQEQQKELNGLARDTGVLEAQKHNLLHSFATTSKEVEEFKIELEKEYGQVNINMQTGEYSEIAEDE